MIQKLLSKKFAKIVPLWLILVITLSGTVAAASLVYISNRLNTPITVTAPPVTIAGNFASTAYKDVPVTTTFTYTVGSAAVNGYLQFIFYGPFTSTNDVDVTAKIGSSTFGPAASGGVVYEPMGSGHGYCKFLYAVSPEANPFNFAASSSGTIEVTTTYHVLAAGAGDIMGYLQITSNTA